MFAYDKQGKVFAMREGAELLVHDGPSEGPLWRKTLDGDIVGLGADSDRITAITAKGTVAWFPAQGGDMQSASLGGDTTFAVVGTTKRRVAAVLASGVVALENNIPVALTSETASAIAMGPDGTVLVATASKLVVIPEGGEPVTTAHELGAIKALAWHPAGFWVIGAATKIWRWTGEGEPLHVTNLPSGKECTHVAASKEAISIGYGGNSVVTIEWPSRETLGSVEYLENTVQGIDFGPWPWLGIAIDKGDGNKQNLTAPTGLHRSDTHPGREHHRWLVQVGGGSKKAAPTSSPTPSAASARSDAAAMPRARTSPPFPIGIVLGVIATIVLLVLYAMR